MKTYTPGFTPYSSPYHETDMDGADRYYEKKKAGDANAAKVGQNIRDRFGLNSQMKEVGTNA